MIAIQHNRALLQFKISRNNKLGVLSVGISNKDAEAIEAILDRNVCTTHGFQQ